MAVCVVCLLCAEHLPCKHVLASATKDIKNNDEFHRDFIEYEAVSNSFGDDFNFAKFYDKNTVGNVKNNENNQIVRRTKRHADHGASHKHHHIEMPEVTKNFIQKIFHQFNEQSEQMNTHGFESMIAQLKLNHLFNGSLNDRMCMSEETFLEKMTHSEHKHEAEHEHHEEHEEEDEDHHHHDHIDISSDNMLSICPILLYYAINRDAANSCLHISNFSTLDTNDESAQLIEMEDRKLVWMYSTLSIILISLCGLFGVAVIPIMEKHFYHHILQFLVALAVGTLAGDALLHLLPHAMLPLSNDQDLHHTMMYRGLAAMLGIVFFYFFERFMVIVMEWKQKKEKREKPSSRVRVMRDPETVSLNGVTTCKHKYSSYPYCYDEIAMETKDDHHEHQHVVAEETVALNNRRDLKISPSTDVVKKPNGLIHDNSNDVDTTTLTLSTSLDDGSIGSNALCNNNKLSGNPVSHSTGKPGANIQQENYTIILREHQSKHHGHSHTHGHVHSPPESLSAVAWMVILGDGLHNFTDGMAIGAAFSNNIAGGFSTAVAVFCHELPHELGDFAVLLKAGMSPRKAVYYNMLSSVLCFFGMCAGIFMGDTPEASQWIFAVAAGLFIYIALVDMMPELTSSHGKDENCMLSQFFLQFVGMCTGFMCMLLIAIYEHDLKEMFTA